MRDEYLARRSFCERDSLTCRSRRIILEIHFPKKYLLMKDGVTFIKEKYK
jgi:hypothetical protein